MNSACATWSSFSVKAGFPEWPCSRRACAELQVSQKCNSWAILPPASLDSLQVPALTSVSPLLPGPAENECQKLMCQCDEEIAYCLAKAEYHIKYLFYPHFLCEADSPKCDWLGGLWCVHLHKQIKFLFTTEQWQSVFCRRQLRPSDKVEKALCLLSLFIWELRTGAD
jgi:hypothetical protein